MLHIKPETVAGGKEMFQRTQLDTTAKVGRRCRAARPSGSSALPVHGDGDGESESAAMPTAGRGNDYDGNYLLESCAGEGDKGIKPMKSSGTVSAVLHHKGSEIWSVPAEATVFDAIKIMADKNIGALLVMSGGKLAGVFSERDYTRKVALQGKSSRETRVRDIISTEVISVGLHHSVEECMKLMTEHRVRHLPVVEGEKVVGLVSIGDLVNWTISTQSATIDQMTHYITGGYPT
jgi:CBS domain-containing protein